MMGREKSLMGDSSFLNGWVVVFFGTVSKGSVEVYFPQSPPRMSTRKSLGRLVVFSPFGH